MSDELETTMNRELTEANNKLWQLLNIVRRNLSTDECFVFLYLLLYIKETGSLKGIVKNQNDGQFYSSDYFVGSFSEEQKKIRVELLKSFQDYFEPTLEKLSTNSLLEIQSVIYSFDKTFFAFRFPAIFDFILFEIAKLQGKFSGQFYQPNELTRLVHGLIGLPERHYVYNPFAGIASYGLLLPDRTIYCAQESNYPTWIIGSLRLFAHFRLNHDRFLEEDAIENWGMKTKEFLTEEIEDIIADKLKYDLILSTPPFSMRLTTIEDGKFGPIRTVEHFLIEKGLEELKQNGKLIAVLL